jgi:hypothetical protein
MQEKHLFAFCGPFFAPLRLRFCGKVKDFTAKDAKKCRKVGKGMPDFLGSLELTAAG